MEITMQQTNFPLADKNGILRLLPKELSSVSKKRINKFGGFMFMYDFVQDYWVRPRIHKADPKKHWEIMHELIKSVKAATVLDIACGTGGAIPHFDNSNDYTGLDLSYTMLRYAVKKARKRDFIKYAFVEGNAEELYFPEETFYFVLIDTSLHMIEKYQSCIAEAARVLKKGGDLVCSCPSVGINKEFDMLWTKIAPKRHLHSLKESDLQTVCLENKLTYYHINTNGGVLYFRARKDQ
jgi:ubiquinone/menaquinone biosynthesis C-methylase UbiE